MDASSDLGHEVDRVLIRPVEIFKGEENRGAGCAIADFFKQQILKPRLMRRTIARDKGPDDLAVMTRCGLPERLVLRKVFQEPKGLPQRVKRRMTGFRAAGDREQECPSGSSSLLQMTEKL
ncbi:MAG: hypothetical protein WBB38_10965 [Hyphomicrobiaceae bacterium]